MFWRAWINSPPRRAVFALLIALCSGGGLFADDDEIVVSTAVETTQQDLLDVRANFDQWLFPGVNNADVGKQRVETRIQLQLAEIDRACQLTVAQKERLALAARGDARRFFGEVDRLRAKFEAAKNDQDVINRMWQEIQPLQTRQATGLTGPDSLLMKILPKTLDAEQAQAYAAVTSKHYRFRYRATIAVALHNLEGTVALNHEQRTGLTRMLNELPPPRTTGRYDYYLVLLRLAGLPQNKVRPLVDERQWKALEQAFGQARAMRARLVEQGYMADDLD